MLQLAYQPNDGDGQRYQAGHDNPSGNIHPPFRCCCRHSSVLLSFKVQTQSTNLAFPSCSSPHFAISCSNLQCPTPSEEVKVLNGSTALPGRPNSSPINVQTGCATGWRPCQYRD